MTNEEIANYLSGLVKLDYDAMLAYEQAMSSIEDKDINRHFQVFHDEHSRHITELNEQISALGHVPVERSRDLKGFFIEGFTAIRGMTGTNGALRAMEANEKTTTQQYKEAIEKVFPINISAVLQKNYSDEIRHLEYIDQELHMRAR